MKNPTLTPRESSLTVVRGLHQHQEDRANNYPHGRPHNRDPDSNTHGESHGLAGDGSAHWYEGIVGVHGGIHHDNNRT